MEVNDQLQAPAALPSGKDLDAQLDKRLEGPQSLSGRCGEQKNLSLAGIRTPAVKPKM
jgi:hypothetical protein